MIEKLRSQVAAAMKAGDRPRLSILRVLMGELQMGNITTDCADAHKIVRKLMVGNAETIRILQEQKEACTIEHEIISMGARQRILEDENKVLQDYLPAYLTKDEIKVALQPMLQALKEAKSVGQATGFAIRYLKDRPIDGSTVKQAVEELRQ